MRQRSLFAHHLLMWLHLPPLAWATFLAAASLSATPIALLDIVYVLALVVASFFSWIVFVVALRHPSIVVAWIGIATVAVQATLALTVLIGFFIWKRQTLIFESALAVFDLVIMTRWAFLIQALRSDHQVIPLKTLYF